MRTPSVRDTGSSAGVAIWFYYPRIVEHDGPRVVFRWIRWRRPAIALLVASGACLGLWLALGGIGGHWYPLPFALAVLLSLLGSLAWITDVTQYTLTLDCAARSYYLTGGWPGSKVASRGSIADLAQLRLEREEYPRRSPAALRRDGKWILGPRFRTKQWLVLYLDIRGDPKVSFQLQGSAVLPAGWPAAEEAEPAMRHLLLSTSELLQLPMVDAAGGQAAATVV